MDEKGSAVSVSSQGIWATARIPPRELILRAHMKRSLKMYNYELTKSLAHKEAEVAGGGAAANGIQSAE